MTVGGTLIPTDRIAAEEPYCSQKNKRHGMNAQVIAIPDGPRCGCLRLFQDAPMI
ncbi:hypothetical protein [Streptomyces sp. YGL11-2]|uniref:hypothetical protein n=1 Tax=Streptomyces sp. YGL11-2 TaxID=3414028 RepID=UPI003CEFA6E4